MKAYFCLYALMSSLISSSAFAQPEQNLTVRFEQKLNEALDQARAHSGSLKSAVASEEAASFQAKASEASLLPNLSLQGNYFYQTEVPTLTLGPLGTESFGTHNNYSVGPVLSYTVFDGGRDRENRDNYDLLAKAREQTRKVQSAQLELNVRQAYFRVQYALRELDLTVDSLKLSQAQFRDIELRYRAGAASRLDEVQAQRDVISYRLRFRQAQADLASNFRDLLALEGDMRELDATRPVGAGLSQKLPEGVESPTLELSLEPLEATLISLGSQPLKFAGASHPEAQVLESQAEASRQLAESEKSGLYPRLAFQAKAQYEYPNIILPQSIWQETIGATLTFPLYEGDASRSTADQHLREAASSDFQRDQKLTDLARDQNKAQDAWESLKSQKKINDDNVTQAKEVERLTYQSYKAGKSRYLDVQDANLKLLQAEVSAAQIDSEILTELAILTYLSVETL